MKGKHILSVILINFFHTSHTSHLVNESAILSNDCSCLLGSNFCDLDLPLPVVDTLLQLLALVFLSDEFDWLWHVLDEFLKTNLCSILVISFPNIFLGFYDGSESLLSIGSLGFHLCGIAFLHGVGISQFLLESIECLYGHT
jgi:hypothetical protein